MSLQQNIQILYANLVCQADSTQWQKLPFNEKMSNNKRLFQITFLRRKHSNRKESS